MSTDGAKGKLVHKHKKTPVNDRPTFKSGLHSRLDVRRSPFAIRFWAKGRVAESGLRHSTRNRASRNNGTVGSNPTPSASFCAGPLGEFMLPKITNFTLAFG